MQSCTTKAKNVRLSFKPFPIFDPLTLYNNVIKTYIWQYQLHSTLLNKTNAASQLLAPYPSPLQCIRKLWRHGTKLIHSIITFKHRFDPFLDTSTWYICVESYCNRHLLSSCMPSRQESDSNSLYFLQKSTIKVDIEVRKIYSTKSTNESNPNIQTATSHHSQTQVYSIYLSYDHVYTLFYHFMSIHHHYNAKDYHPIVQRIRPFRYENGPFSITCFYTIISILTKNSNIIHIRHYWRRETQHLSF